MRRLGGLAAAMVTAAVMVSVGAAEARESLAQGATSGGAAAAQPAIYLGTAWYPEQWPEARWDVDLTLMEKAGVRFVRVTEFAWSRLEPSEGHYDLDWVERAVRMAERHHIAVVLGTPTAAPPAWMTQRYPETLAIEEDGRRMEHGNRAQENWTNPRYTKFAAEMAGAMAARFGHDPNVIGWQLDNEIGTESFDPYTKQLWQAWLKAKYGSLDELNRRWTTTYWSQTYFDWSQIPIETKTGNPGLLLDWRRFASDMFRSYDKVQIDAIRAKADKRQWITTNMMGWFDTYDHYVVSQDLDLASWDDYVGTGQLDPVRNGATHDLTRGFLRKNFWVMETQPGFVNWKPNNNALNKGEVRAMAWHDIGHGADAVSYWQWRSALNGQEEYHGTLLGADGTPVPLYDEVAQVGKDFAKAGPALAGTTVKSEVAIVHSYDSRWAVNFQRHNTAFDPVDALVSYYGPVRKLVHSVDVVKPTAPLAQYKLVIAPALNLLTEADAKSLMAYVQGGGHLVLGQRSAMKDGDNALAVERQPGPLATMLGGRVEQYYALDKNVPLTGEWGSGEGTIWAEQLSAGTPETTVLMRYGKSNGWLDGQPAAVTRQAGKGRITYIGAWLDDATMANAAKWMVETSGVKPEWGVMPEGVDLYLREGAGKKTAIVVNFGAETKTVELPRAMEDVLAGGIVQRVTLPQYGVEVLSTK